MSLGRNYRFNVFNSTGVTVPKNTVTITARRWNFNSTGVQVWESPEATIASSGDNTNLNSNSLSNGSYGAGSGLDNSGSAYLGGTFKLVADFTNAGVSPSGNMVFYLQRSTDGGITFPDNGYGSIVGILNCVSKLKFTNEIEI